jgi:hypothetical protein
MKLEHLAVFGQSFTAGVVIKALRWWVGGWAAKATARKSRGPAARLSRAL